MKYEIELDEEQMETVIHSLEFYYRIYIGQWQEIPRELIDLNDNEYLEKYDETCSLLMDARKVVYPELPADTSTNYSVTKFDKSINAMEIHEVLRHCRAWAKNPNGGWTVDFDRPISFSGKPLCKCRAVKNDE